MSVFLLNLAVNKMKESNEISDPQLVPPHLLQDIFGFLPVDNLINVALTCHFWNSTLKDEVWHISYMNSFGGPLEDWNKTVHFRRQFHDFVPLKRKSWKRHARETIALFIKYLECGKEFVQYAGSPSQLVPAAADFQLPLTALLNGTWKPENITKVFVWAVYYGHYALARSILCLPGGAHLADMKVLGWPLGNDEWRLDTNGEDENQPISIYNMHMDIDEFLGARPRDDIKSRSFVVNNLPILALLQRFSTIL